MSVLKEEVAVNKIAFLPMGETIDNVPGETILDSARRSRIRIASSCGGHGTCVSCAIQFIKGDIPEPVEADKDVFSDRRLKEGWRRACLTKIEGDCSVFVPPRATAAPVRTQVDGQAEVIDFEPAVKVIPFDMPPADLEDCRSDDQRLREALAADHPGACEKFDAALLQTLADDLRAWKWHGWIASCEGEVIAAGPKGGHALGLAVDLGTTNVSGFLIDMTTGETLAAEGLANPQTVYGADLITYASQIRRNPEVAETLQQLAIDALNQLADDLCDACGMKKAHIVEVTVAGNTMMHHLLLGLPVRQLAMSPFVSALSDAFNLKARGLGVDIAPGAYIHLLPNIAGFIGGDHVASLLASPPEDDRPVIIMDIGTNTEISLVEGQEITSVSCPSGPAFEGGHITCGMRAAQGAIEMVRIKGDEVQLEVIDDGAPVGLCGSGVLDVTAQIHLAGVCDDRGRLDEDNPHVRVIDGKRHFVMAEEDVAGGPTAITFSQDDLRAVQLAKAAIRSATDLLLEATGHTEQDLGRVIIAGAFGNYIDIGSALAIGMLPDLPFNKFAQIGNAAGDGARYALLSLSQREEAKNIARRSNYMELASTASYMKVFGSRINFEKRKSINA